MGPDVSWKAHSALSQEKTGHQWVKIFTVGTGSKKHRYGLSLFQTVMVFSVHLQTRWHIPKPWNWLNWYHKGDCWKKSSLYNSKAYLHKESINFPSLGVICGKERERRKRKKISLKLSELSNFYHLQCTFLPPRSPLNVKWQGRTQGLATRVPEWQSGEVWSSPGTGGRGDWDSPVGRPCMRHRRVCGRCTADVFCQNHQ